MFEYVPVNYAIQFSRPVSGPGMVAYICLTREQ
jgi:hypothetical protein